MDGNKPALRHITATLQTTEDKKKFLKLPKGINR